MPVVIEATVTIEPTVYEIPQPFTDPLVLIAWEASLPTPQWRGDDG